MTIFGAYWDTNYRIFGVEAESSKRLYCQSTWKVSLKGTIEIEACKLPIAIESEEGYIVVIKERFSMKGLCVCGHVAMPWR